MTDSRPILPTIDPLSYLRTVVPVLWGSFLAFLAAQIPLVSVAFAAIDKQLGEGWRQLAAALATAAVIAAYYWLARQIGRRWPAAERWLIGSSSQPIYFQNAAQLAAPEVKAVVIEPGEIVLSKDAVSELGTAALQHMNQVADRDRGTI